MRVTHKLSKGRQPMLPIKALLRSVMRGGVIIPVLVVALPWLALTALGLVWLAQNGWFFTFVIAMTAAVILASLPRWLRIWHKSRRPVEIVEDQDEGPIVAANPDWSAREVQIYRALCAEIEKRLPEPRLWSNMPTLAFDVAEAAAQKLSDGKKGALAFSIPEALLITDRIILRIRGTIRETLPFADRVSIETLLWLWQKQAELRSSGNAAMIGWRLFRLATLPVQAVLQEVQNAVLAGAGDFLTNRSLLVLQRMILEEVAHAAIELQSGRLRFTDEELLSIQLGSETADLAALAQPDAPLRLLVIGQVSAGKSTLINALAETDLAETDMAPTTPGVTRHDIDLNGIPYHVIDTQGLVGGGATEDAILKQMLDCDMILWVVRANRPARAPDVALMTRFNAEYVTNHSRRKPPVVIAISATDTLLPGWPFAENILPDSDRTTVSALVAAIERDLGQAGALPVCAEDPVWNIDVLARTIGDSAKEAIMTQRNRRRLDGVEQQTSWAAEVGRARQGVAQTAGVIWSRLAKRE
jgi:predicted GTPase